MGDTQRARQRIVGVKHCPLKRRFVILLTVRLKNANTKNINVLCSDTSLTASTIQVRGTQRARQRIVGVKHCPLEREFVILLTVSLLNIMHIFLNNNINDDR